MFQDVYFFVRLFFIISLPIATATGITWVVYFCFSRLFHIEYSVFTDGFIPKAIWVVMIILMYFMQFRQIVYLNNIRDKRRAVSSEVRDEIKAVLAELDTLNKDESIDSGDKLRRVIQLMNRVEELKQKAEIDTK